MSPRPAAALALAVLALGLASCAGEQAPDPVGQPTDAPQTQAPPEATTDPETTPDPAAEPTCETIISPYVVEELEDLGWSPREDPFLLGSTELPEGIQCIWGDQSVASDHVQIYGWAPVDAATAAESQGVLQSEGWVLLEEEGSVFLTENPDHVVMADREGYGMTYQFGDGWVALSDTKQGLEIVRWPAAG